jgi:hypothetical protein
MTDDRKGKFIVMVPTAHVLEIIEESALLDFGFAVRLNMEGEHTGQHVIYRPSDLYDDERTA